METEDNQFFAVSAPCPNCRGTQGDFLKCHWTFNLVLLSVFIVAEDRGRDVAVCNQSTRCMWLRVAGPQIFQKMIFFIWEWQGKGCCNLGEDVGLGRANAVLPLKSWIQFCLFDLAFYLSSVPIHYENLKSFIFFCWCCSDPELSMKSHGFLKLFWILDFRH